MPPPRSPPSTPLFFMHGTEPRWNIDLQMGESERVACSVNHYADLLITRMKTAHELVRQHLGTTANKMSEWYDKKVHTQSFLPGDQVFVLNLRQYRGGCPKWMRQYSHIATVKKKKRCHVSTVVRRMETTIQIDTCGKGKAMYCRYTVSRQCSNRTDYTVKCGFDCGGSDSPEADTTRNRRA